MNRILNLIQISLFIAIIIVCACCANKGDSNSLHILKIATYNILAGDRGLKGIIEAIKKLDPDIIALQEVDRKTKRSGRVDQPDRISKAVGMHYVFRKHFNYQGGEFGLMILSKFKIEQVERINVSQSNLIILSAFIDTPHGKIKVINVHFHPVEWRKNIKEKQISISARYREALQAYNIANNTSSPVVILGDFNSSPISEIYRIFKNSYQDAGQYFFAWCLNTYPDIFPIFRIDYIWASQHWRILNCNTVQSHASDHLPVVAKLALTSCQ